MLENRVLRRIFGPKRSEVTGGWRKMHSEKLHDFYSSTYVIRIIKLMRMRWVGQRARMAEMRNVYKIVGEKPEGKRLLGRSRHT
jgi:hypothetical protein